MVTMFPTHSYSGVVVLYFFFLLSFVLLSSASPKPYFRHQDQMDALLEFKHEFSMSYLSSWNKSSDCCSWEGVTCDTSYGNVISLHLDNVSLNNSLKPISGLFKLQYLEYLNLRECNLSGEIPSSLGNLSHLTFLDLSGNELVGKVPTSIGNLTRLNSLSLTNNHLSGKIPVSFANLTKLSTLRLYNNNFESELPLDMSGLHNLEYLSLDENSFSGPFPTFLFTIPSLQMVYLRRNQFKGSIEFGNTSSSSKLRALSLASNNCDGLVPASISKFLHLNILDLSFNNFIGPIPTSISKLVNLTYLDLSHNKLEGKVPSCLWKLEVLELAYNSFSGFGNLSKVFDGTKMTVLSLRSNSFRGPFPHWICKLRSLELLDLSFNNFIGSIPTSISKLVNLIYLDLSHNKLEGKVPSCLWKLKVLELAYNSFSGFGNLSKVFDGTKMTVLSLRSNSFRGPFPHWICKLRSLELLDLSINSFNGSIPPCLRNITNGLVVLNLRNNDFNGLIPEMFVNATNLKEVDISCNQIEGKLPQSLSSCKAMNFLNVGRNNFKDKFPSWLGSLPSLNVFILRSNQFYGPLYHNHSSIGFQMLKVIDISQNDFTGTFPAFYFSSWLEMTTLQYDNMYMEEFMVDVASVRNSVKMVYKGVDREFTGIRGDFIAIDFSGNKFRGRIPESIGLLKGLRLLNLSSNAFSRDIPQSLANLTNLEALDLSRNRLEGQIPQNLGTLSFLSTMNFSHNNLEGPIPQSTQFLSQDCSSFSENSRLYGLEEICGKTHVLNQPDELQEHEKQEISWIAAAIAYGPGVFCGFVIGHIFFSDKHEWFVEKFRKNKPGVVIKNPR